ncbi:hypothetical protein CYPRO_1321 [Cyclonatronum proteinivorum]|uniref:Uncharacterized protein n=2 Tax=Cyclonatronum proteinivorum TaxID=1457365 RepID=A0A345UJC6_9BACT|nr:hypothetical protein CYPRO_1321 [Cyclonatronum proteinivorum]
MRETLQYYLNFFYFFSRNNNSDLRNTFMKIPFSIEKKTLISRESGGTLSLHGDDLVFRFSDENLPSPWHIPLPQIKYISLDMQLTGGKVTLHTLSRELAAPFTDGEDVSFTLNIKKAHASEAKSFIRFVKLRLAETIVRGLSENPYTQQ